MLDSCSYYPLLSSVYTVAQKRVVTSESKFVFFLADFLKFREIADIMSRDEKYKADSYLYVVDKNQRAHFEGLKAKKSICQETHFFPESPSTLWPRRFGSKSGACPIRKGTWTFYEVRLGFFF